MARRTTKRQQGYGEHHVRLRRMYARRLRTAEVLPCARCGLPVYDRPPEVPPAAHVPVCPRRRKGGRRCAGECWHTWDLGHSDDRRYYNGIEHACCNRRAGAIASNTKPTPAPIRPGVTNDYGW